MFHSGSHALESLSNCCSAAVLYMTLIIVVLCEGFVKYTVSTVDMMSTRYTEHNLYSTKTNNLKTDSAESVTVEVVNVNGTVVSRGYGATGVLVISNVQLWWPYTMNNHSSPYLYTLQVQMCSLSCIVLCRAR